MRIYLDVCALKRRYDDRGNPRVDAETRAVHRILELVRSGTLRLIWSSAITFENDADPDLDVRTEVAQLRSLCCDYASYSAVAAQRIRALAQIGLRPLDAAHLAFAEQALAERLITCDDRFIARAGRVSSAVRVCAVLEFVKEVDDERP